MNFRFKALAKRRHPERLDTPMTLASTPAWIVTLVVASCFALVGFYGAFGDVPTTTVADGRLVYDGGVSSLGSPVTGVVRSVHVEPGDELTGKEAVAQVEHEKKVAPVVVGVTGRVVEVSVRPGAFVTTGSPLMTFEPGYAADAKMKAELLVPASTVGAVEPGQPVLISVAGHDPRRFGLLRGTVSERAAFPEQADGLEVGPTRVVVELDRASTPSGYEWTSQSGPDLPLESQTAVEAEIVTGHGSPLAAILGG